MLVTAGGWPASPGVWRIVGSDALLIEAGLLALAAPLVGVALAPTPGVFRRMVPPVAAFTSASLTATLVVASATGLTWAPALRSHATLAAVAVALAALGAFVRSRCDDLLDAAAASVTVSVALTGFLIAAGPATANWSQAVVDGGLLANPVIAIASAAGIDPLRGEALYQLSPIAHRRFTYPSWDTTLVTYTAAAALLVLASLRTNFITRGKGRE